MKETEMYTAPDPQVIFTQVDDKEAVLLHLETKMYYSLNETGIRIWQMLEQGFAADRIRVNLQEHFDITPEKANDSLRNFMQELITEKLLVEAAQ